MTTAAVDAVVVTLSGPADVSGWRDAARALVRQGRPPEAVTWRVEGEPGDLLAKPFDPGAGGGQVRATRRFLGLVEQALLHSAPERFALCYRLLWRLQDDPGLMERAADPDLRRADELARSVRRDMHKMKAFVRFRRVPGEDGERFLAWFEPDHHVVEATAPFFARRFAAMRWGIVTPRRSVAWDGTGLRFGPGGRREDVPADDAMEEAWRRYYAAIFNPARLKLHAMRAEMPVKYWKNLPEARLIPELTRAAAPRLQTMLEREARMEKPEGPEAKSLPELSRLIGRCERCPLYRDATQAVPGAGPADAALMFVGEQPGDREDREGAPFVGPAGQLFDQALAEVGIDRDACYVTNAVKHFKFRIRGRRRIHQSPSTGEISQCRWWLDQEIDLVRPKIVVALGASAARAVLRRQATISKLRGTKLDLPSGPQGFVTVHPSYLLRLPEPEAKAREYEAFKRDLTLAAEAV